MNIINPKLAETASRLAFNQLSGELRKTLIKRGAKWLRSRDNNLIPVAYDDSMPDWAKGKHDLSYLKVSNEDSNVLVHIAHACKEAMRSHKESHVVGEAEKFLRKAQIKGIDELHELANHFFKVSVAQTSVDRKDLSGIESRPHKEVSEYDRVLGYGLPLEEANRLLKEGKLSNEIADTNMRWVNLPASHLGEAGQVFRNCLANGYYKSDVKKGNQSIWALVDDDDNMVALARINRGQIAEIQGDVRREDAAASILGENGVVIIKWDTLFGEWFIDDKWWFEVGCEGDERGSLVSSDNTRARHGIVLQAMIKKGDALAWESDGEKVWSVDSIINPSNTVIVSNNTDSNRVLQWQGDRINNTSLIKGDTEAAPRLVLEHALNHLGANSVFETIHGVEYCGYRYKVYLHTVDSCLLYNGREFVTISQHAADLGRIVVMPTALCLAVVSPEGEKGVTLLKDHPKTLSLHPALSERERQSLSGCSQFNWSEHGMWARVRGGVVTIDHKGTLRSYLIRNKCIHIRRGSMRLSGILSEASTMLIKMAAEALDCRIQSGLRVSYEYTCEGGLIQAKPTKAVRAKVDGRDVTITPNNPTIMSDGVEVAELSFDKISMRVSSRHAGVARSYAQRFLSAGAAFRTNRWIALAEQMPENTFHMCGSIISICGHGWSIDGLANTKGATAKIDLEQVSSAEAKKIIDDYHIAKKSLSATTEVGNDVSDQTCKSVSG